ncbi:MAG: hypothetical protein N3A61_00040, partial [Ignavibacteria bacterium]|nr:hypothetical protein [Ignavibacteria bacterium]
MKYKDFLTQIKNEEISAQSENEPSRFSSSENLESLIEIVKKINNSLILDEVLKLVIINAIKLAKAERGFLILVNDIDELQYRIGLNSKGEVVPEDSFEISWSVVKDAYDLGESICIENALQDQIFNSRQSIMNLELQTILCKIARDKNCNF